MFYNKTKGFIFLENNLLPYEYGLANLRDTKLMKQGRKVSFKKEIIMKKDKDEMLRVYWATLQLADYFCTSLLEINYLKRLSMYMLARPPAK